MRPPAVRASTWRGPKRLQSAWAEENDPIRACGSIECHGVKRTLLSVGHGLHPEREQVRDMLLDLLRRRRDRRSEKASS